MEDFAWVGAAHKRTTSDGGEGARGTCVTAALMKASICGSSELTRAAWAPSRQRFSRSIWFSMDGMVMKQKAMHACP